MIVSGNPDIAQAPIEEELCALVNAVGLFVENYRRMHARTLYAPRVEAAAKRLKEKLLEL